MSHGSAAVLERLLRENNLGWMVDKFEPRERALPLLLERLDRVAAEYQQRLHVNVPFTPEALEAEARQNPHKVRAFLQALGTSGSAEMLVMVWRILQGLCIREVTMRYQEQKVFDLLVVLARPAEEQDEPEPYQSHDINDAALVRHFGITTIDGRPLFDGFFPIRQK